jgi:hypothetical protein
MTRTLTRSTLNVTSMEYEWESYLMSLAACSEGPLIAIHHL